MCLQVEQEKAQKEKDNLVLDTEIEKLNDAYSKLSKERKTLEEKLQVCKLYKILHIHMPRF